MIHGRAQKFKEAMKIFAEAKLSGYNAELWLIEGDPNGDRYAVISRVKRRGRNPKLKLLDRLDGECLEALRLPKEFRIVGRWVECIALSDRKTLLVKGERLRLQPKARAVFPHASAEPPTLERKVFKPASPIPSSCV